MTKEFTVEVKEEVYRASDDDKSPISVDVISWNGGEAKLNIRRMYKDKKSGEFKFGKGVTLSDSEMIAVYKALGGYIEKYGISVSSGVV